MTDDAVDRQSPVACPRCGEPVVLVRVVGPMEGIAGPCGCRVVPDSVAGMYYD